MLYKCKSKTPIAFYETNNNTQPQPSPNQIMVPRSKLSRISAVYLL